MNFAAAEDEMRERFVESLALFNHIRQTSPADFSPLDNIQRSMRGLWLVSLYAAFERGANVVIEAAVEEISEHEVCSIDCVPAIQSIIHYSKIQAVKDCGPSSIFDKSVSLFISAFSNTPLQRFENPLPERMMNVDGGTLKWLAGLFGAPVFQIDAPDLGRLATLRERRNAVAHGRESASNVGERYTLDEMSNIYAVADRVSTAFLLTMKDHCIGRNYLRTAA